MWRLFRSPQFIAGVAVIILTLLPGWGVPMIFPSTPHLGVLLTVIGIVISAPLFYWAYVLYKHQKNNKQANGKQAKSSAVGGLVGRSVGGRIENSSFKGKITVNGDSKDVDVGGLVGQSQDTEIVNSGADAEIERASERHLTEPKDSPRKGGKKQ